jgi:predicted TIM-barrel enzyme
MHSRLRRPTAFLRSFESKAAMKHSRKEVRERLRKTLEAGRPVIAAGAGIGLSAKFAEKGGADLVIIYNSGRYRMTGYSSLCGYLPIGDANAIVKEMGEREVLPVTRDTPVIAGVFAADPTREMAHFLGELIDLGFSGVINFPSIAWIEGELRAGLESSGLGFQREVDMIRIAGEAGLFTLAYVFTPDEAIAMAKAGVDSVVAHMGNTVGGSVGQPHAIALEAAAELTQKIVDAARKENREIIALCHGGPIAVPSDFAFILDRTDVEGFVGASSMERLPVEVAIESTTKAFKALPAKGRRVPLSP